MSSLNLRKATLIVATALTAITVHAAPKLVWLNPKHDFGAFREEVGPVSCTFEAVNVGDEPVVIVDARANCGCTVPRYNREPIAPGDTLRVSVSYDPSGRPGRFSKQVKVSTNTSTTAILSIRGTVIGSANTLSSRYPEQAGDIRFSNRISPFGETTKGRVLAAAINMYNPTSDTIVPTVESLPPYINVLIRPETIPPGEQGTISLTAYTDRTSDYGLIEGSFMLVPDKKNPDNRAEIQTVMIVNEDFSKLTAKEREQAPKAEVSEKSIDFGVMDHNGSEVEKILTVTNAGQTPLLIRRAYSPQTGVDIKLSTQKVKPGKTAKVTIAVDPQKIEGEMLNARLTLITNDPDNASQIIRLVGEMKK